MNHKFQSGSEANQVKTLFQSNYLTIMKTFPSKNWFFLPAIRYHFCFSIDLIDSLNLIHMEYYKSFMNRCYIKKTKKRKKPVKNDG